MKDPNDKSTVDVFSEVKRGRRGPPKTTSDAERREQNRIRQQRYQERKKDTAKAMAFALGLIAQVEKRKNRSSKSVLLEFVQFLQGLKESAVCEIEDSDGNTKEVTFEQLRDEIKNETDIYRVF